MATLVASFSAREARDQSGDAQLNAEHARVLGRIRDAPSGRASALRSNGIQLDYFAYGMESRQERHGKDESRQERHGKDESRQERHGNHGSERKVSEQPYQNHDVLLLFDGSLFPSCAIALKHALKLPTSTKTLALIHAQWRTHGAQGLLKLEGNYAFLLVDLAQQLLLAQRDLLGARALYFRQHGPFLQFSSESFALSQCDQNGRPEVDPQTLAEQLCGQPTQEEFTLFKGVRALQAGQQLRFELTQLHNLAPAHQELKIDFSPNRRTDQDNSDALLWALQVAVRDAIDDCSAEEIGVSLSGGLDSNAVFAVCHQQLQSPQLCALSWSLEAFPTATEQAFARLHAETRNTRWIGFAGEPFHCLSGHTRHQSLETPLSNIYRELKTELAVRARQAGVRKLFSGNFGDALFLEPHEYLADAIQQRSAHHVTGEFLRRARSQPLLWREPGIRRLLRRVLGLSVHQKHLAPELTPTARALASQRAISSQNDLPALRARLYQLNLSASAQFSAHAESEYAHAVGVEIVSPLRHRAILRTMLNLPWHCSERGGVAKFLLRSALREQLPSAILNRPKSCSLKAFFDATVAGPARAQIAELLFSKHSDWQQFFDPTVIERVFSQITTATSAEHSANSDYHGALLWTCASYERWRIALKLRRE